VDKSTPRAEALYRRLGYQPSSVVKEEFSYRNPAGAMVHVPVELSLFRKRLDGAASGASFQSDSEF
jgi:hypothetical protein